MTLFDAADVVRSSHQPLREVVAAQMRRLILEGTLAPGERLIEDRLAEQLGVSRNPVREAIRILEAEGFLDVTARRGSSVAARTAKHASDLFDVRLALEPLGARLAAGSPAIAEIARMRAILADVDQNQEDHSADELSDLHSELHILVFTMCRNDYLTSIAAPMVKRGQWLLRQAAPLRDAASWQDHHAIIDAIEAGNAELAETVARQHVLQVRTQLLATFA